MADNFSQGEEIQIGNRRLRKIKRPKQHGGPIAVSNNDFSTQFSNEDSQSLDITPVQDINYQQQYIEEDPEAYDSEALQSQMGYVYGVVEKKKVVWIAIACIIFGLVAGKFLFSSSQVIQNGLQGVVINPEVPKGRSRCGLVEKTQGCVLYVMNPQRQELNGRDFYDLASQLTGRQRFVIETGNMRYSSMKIKPGGIAQLNIPPLQ